MQEERTSSTRAVETHTKEIGLAWRKPALEPAMVGCQLCSCGLQLPDADHCCVGGIDGADKVVRLVDNHNASCQSHTQSLPRLLCISLV